MVEMICNSTSTETYTSKPMYTVNKDFSTNPTPNQQENWEWSTPYLGKKELLSQVVFVVIF
jgi:hypothetical protein